MTLRLSAAQERVFNLHGLGRILGVDSSRLMHLQPGDCATIREALAGIGRSSCHYRSAAAIRRKLDRIRAQV